MVKENKSKPLSPNVSRSELSVDNVGYKSSNRTSVSSSFAEMGAVRKKSVMHGASEPNSNYSTVTENDFFKFDKCKEFSNTGSKATSALYENRTWWYQFCLKCNAEDEDKPSWEPKHWQLVFPKPYFPTYRTISRLLALVSIGMFCWCILYSIVGEIVAPPNGQLYQLLLLSICAHCGGWLTSLTTLPALVGMLFTGLLFQNVNIVNIDGTFSEMSHIVSEVSLVIILTRAGLDLDPEALRKVKYSVIKLSTIPWLTETVTVTLLAKYWLGISWSFSVMLGCVIAAVAPAVVVPCLFRLRIKGYGVAKGIPTLIIAVSSIDDSLSVAVFGIIKTIIFSDSSTTNVMILGPLSIVAGIVLGALWGLFCNVAPERNDPFLVPLRVLVLLAGNMGAVFGSELLGYSGAGPVACVASAFVAISCWSKAGWDIEDNPAATAFEIFWQICQPVLFGITGARIRLNEIDGQIILTVVAVIVTGIVIRMLVTVVVGIGSKLNLKEKIFVAIPWMCKAIVQAALGGVAISLAKEGTIEYEYATKMLNVCILSIILSAPTGALLTTLLGPHLLTKAKPPTSPEIRRRKKSSKMSIRDLNITAFDDAAAETSNGNYTTHSGKISVVIEEADNRKF